MGVRTIFTSDKHRTAVLIDEENYDFLSRFKWISSIINGKPYIATNIRGKTVYLHRIVLCAHPGELVDHANGDVADNRISNLRIANLGQNAANKAKQTGKTSKFKGVCWDKNRSKWMATCNKDGKHYNLGRFDDEIEAAKAYDRRAIVFWGEFAVLNFKDAA